MTNEDPNFHGHRQRLHARFLKSGLAGFADYEVVELLLTLAVPHSDVKQPAKALIVKFGNLRGILDVPIEELRTVPGSGSVTPVALQIIKAAATLYLQQSSEGRDSLADPAWLSEFWRMRLDALHGEVFEVAYLDSAYRLLRDGVETFEKGTIDRAAVYPRRVIEAALKRGAAALVLAHNHPNGNVTPSEHDKDGSDKRQLTHDAAYRDERPLWSTDGSHIFFARLDQSGRASLWLMCSDGSGLHQVVEKLGTAPWSWFGYYGYIQWDDYFEWWIDAPGGPNRSPADNCASP